MLDAGYWILKPTYQNTCRPKYPYSPSYRNTTAPYSPGLFLKLLLGVDFGPSRCHYVQVGLLICNGTKVDKNTIISCYQQIGICDLGGMNRRKPAKFYFCPMTNPTGQQGHPPHNETPKPNKPHWLLYLIGAILVLFLLQKVGCGPVTMEEKTEWKER